MTLERRTVYDVVDSIPYVYGVAYQRMVTLSLDETFFIKRIELKDLQPDTIPEGAIVLSRLRLRTLVKSLEKMSKLLPKDRLLFVYDQDTWTNFTINNPLKGAYAEIFSVINPRTFIVASSFWASRINETNIPCTFAQPWVHPNTCTDESVPWAEKKYDVVFCGSMYAARLKFFLALRRRGVRVSIYDAISEKSYLNVLRSAKITVRTEPLRGKFDLDPCHANMSGMNALWLRDIEAASQGCISMREIDDEYHIWELDRVPTIKTFINVDDAVIQIKQLLMSSASDRDSESCTAIEAVRQRSSGRSSMGYMGWTSVADAVNDASREEVTR